MKVITLTLNPAYDVHCMCKSFEVGYENFATILTKEAGGKGINISRALTNNNVPNTALIVLGRDNEEDFLSKLDNDNILYSSIVVDGRIRENITLHVENDKETRLCFYGFNVDDSLLDKVETKLDDLLDEDSIITFTGQVPLGISLSKTKLFLKKYIDKGIKVVIDSKSFSLLDLIELKPWLIKPNQDELSIYLGEDILNKEEALKHALVLHDKGINNVLVTLGENGACLVNDDGSFLIDSIEIDVVSTIGAGDSTIAGFITGTILNLKRKELLALASSYGSAACLQTGTRPPDAKDIARIFNVIK